MIEIYGNINIERVGGVGAISSGTITAQGNNISANFSEIINNTPEGESNPNPFIIGVSKLGSGATFSRKLNYFMSKQICNENGKFAVPIQITLNGYRMDNFTIVFNSFRNEYPTQIDVNGKSYYPASPIVSISQSTAESSVVTITFDSWNSPNRPLVIEKISDGVSLDINKRNLISFSADNLQRSNNETVSWGIVSNKGFIEIKDFDKRIYSLARNKMLSSNSECFISIKNTLVKGKNERIATMYTEEWEYDTESFIAKVTLKDALEEWQNINISSIEYDHTKNEEYPFSTIYQKLHRLTPAKYNMLAFNELDENTREILENTKCRYPFLKSSSLWSAWHKLCEVCQLYIYNNPNGKTVCNYEYGA